MFGERMRASALTRAVNGSGALSCHRLVAGIVVFSQAPRLCLRMGLNLHVQRSPLIDELHVPGFLRHLFQKVLKPPP